ncbi:MAG: hypothetical protein JOY79_04570 [Acidobacteriaceae bacterium]|nr:hypothetical protein [Acidobacteriaceae bacterium]
MDCAYNSDVLKLAFMDSSCIYPRMAPITEEYLQTGPLEDTNDAYGMFNHEFHVDREPTSCARCPPEAKIGIDYSSAVQRLDILPYRCYGLPYMKTTLNIDDTVMARLKAEAVRQGRTMSELGETALRMLFRPPGKRAELPPLPTFHSGGALVDVADRGALYQAMEGR